MKSQRSLHDIAPRLAVARDIREMEVDHTGDYPGQDFGRVEWFQHSIGRCRHCAASTDRYEARERLLVGCNKGHVHSSWRIKCRHCLTSSYSNYRRLW